MEKKQQLLSPLHQVLICETVVLPQLCQFWDTIRGELADKGPYTASIRGMRMRLPELKDEDKEAMKLRSEGVLEGWEDIEQVLHYQGLPYVPKVIRSELIIRHYDNPLAGHFGIEKTREVIARKYYWPTLRRDVEAYVKNAMFVWLQRQFATSYTEIFNCCPFLLIGGRTCQWTLLQVSQY